MSRPSASRGRLNNMQICSAFNTRRLSARLRATEVRRWNVSASCSSGIASRARPTAPYDEFSPIWNFAEREFDDLDFFGRNPARGIALNRETGREQFPQR